MRGTVERPFRNLEELKKGIKAKRNCTLYTYGTWILPEEVYQEIKKRKITLVGVLQAQINKASKDITQQAMPDLKRETITIHLPKDTEVAVYKDDIIKQIQDSIYKDTFIGGMR